MKVLLLNKEDDYKYKKNLPNEKELIQDLNLEVVFDAMSKGDSFLYKVSKEVVLDSLTELNQIIYRQDILADCLKNKGIALKIYNIANRTLKDADQYMEYTKPNFSKIIPMSKKVSNAVGLLKILIKNLEDLNMVLSETKRVAHSSGLINLCNRLKVVLTNNFFIDVKYHIGELSCLLSSGEMMINAKIGKGMKGADYILNGLVRDELISNEPSNAKHRIFKKKPLQGISKKYIININTITLNDNANEILDAGFVHILRVINHFTNNTMSFFQSLKYEIVLLTYIVCFQN